MRALLHLAAASLIACAPAERRIVAIPRSVMLPAVPASHDAIGRCPSRSQAETPSMTDRLSFFAEIELNEILLLLARHGIFLPAPADAASSDLPSLQPVTAPSRQSPFDDCKRE